MKSRITRRFRKLFEPLPETVQQQARQSFSLWRSDPGHNSLKFKRVGTTAPYFSVRVGIHWRALGRLEGDTLVWFWIGSHAEYDRVIRNL